MIPAYSYKTVCRELTNAFRTRYPGDAAHKVRMVGLVFARPSSPLAAAEIIPNLDYFHHRSGDNIDFFCAGYGGYWEGRSDEFPDQKVVGPGQYTNWLFSAQRFNSFRSEIESMSRWRYSGGADLILTDARYNLDKKESELDFSTAIVINLDKAKAEKAIVNVEQFFEDVFRYAETQSGDDPTWGFSDRMGKRVAGSALKSLVLAILPKSIEEDARKAFHFYVSDINP